MPRILVVYYSRTGHTRRVADDIATLLDADRERLVDRVSRSGFVGYHRSAYEAWFQKVTALEPSKHDVSRYDLVVVGTPVWCLSVSSPVRTFLREHRGQLHDVAFFCTCDGHGGERAMRQMTREAGKAPTGALVLRRADRAQRNASDLVHDFAERIHRVLDARMPIAPSSPRAPFAPVEGAVT